MHTLVRYVRTSSMRLHFHDMDFRSITSYLTVNGSEMRFCGKISAELNEIWRDFERFFATKISSLGRIDDIFNDESHERKNHMNQTNRSRMNRILEKFRVRYRS